MKNRFVARHTRGNRSDQITKLKLLPRASTTRL